MNTPPTYTFKRPPAALAPRRRRRLLAGAYLGVGTLLVASPFILDAHLPPHEMGSQWLMPIAILFAALMLVLLRLQGATRYITDDPDKVLDEMMVRLRNQAYRRAYRIQSTFTMAAVLGLSLAGSYLSDQAKLGIYLAVLVICLGLPVIITAVTLPDIDPEA